MLSHHAIKLLLRRVGIGRGGIVKSRVLEG